MPTGDYKWKPFENFNLKKIFPLRKFRLEIRATQGRVTEEDMLIAGVPLQKE